MAELKNFTSSADNSKRIDVPTEIIQLPLNSDEKVYEVTNDTSSSISEMLKGETAAQCIQRLKNEGFRITRVFDRSEALKFQQYVDELNNNKTPHKDFKFLLGDESNGDKLTILEK